MKNHLINFNSIEEPFIHFTNGIKLFQQLYNQLNEEPSKQLFTTIIDGKDCMNKKALFTTFSSKLQFPDYFGDNWDAFDDCFNDLEWLNSNQYVLFFKNFEELLTLDKDDLDTFLEKIEEAIKEWTLGIDYGIERLPNTKVLPHTVDTLRGCCGFRISLLNINNCAEKSDLSWIFRCSFLFYMR